MPEEEARVLNLQGPVGANDVAFQDDWQASSSMGPVELECTPPNQPPSAVIRRVHNANSPSPQYYHFRGVQTLKFFKAPDGRADLRGCGKVLRPRVGCRV